MGNLFDLDNELLKENNETADALRKAYSLCMREMYREALAIYNKIIEKDYDNEEAYIGILRAHSENFTKATGEEVEKDIRVIKRFFPNTKNEDFLAFVKKIENPEFNQNEFDLYSKEIIKLFKTEYGNLDSTRSKSANDKYIDYFNKVINDAKVAPKYKAIANYCLGLTYELNSEENEARKCYEYVLKHINDYPNYKGEAHYRLTMYHWGHSEDQNITINYAREGYTKYNNENCRDFLESWGLL